VLRNSGTATRPSKGTLDEFGDLVSKENLKIPFAGSSLAHVLKSIANLLIYAAVKVPVKDVTSCQCLLPNARFVRFDERSLTG